jgi:alpha-mannosidase
MRVAETQTLDAEKLASLAWLDGAAYPTDILTENWKKITFNQFHDLAAGSGIAVIYRDAQQDFTEVANADSLKSTNRTQDHRAQHRHQRQRPCSASRVFNSSGMGSQRDRRS